MLGGCELLRPLNGFGLGGGTGLYTLDLGGGIGL
jgi:hypothetical protein